MKNTIDILNREFSRQNYSDEQACNSDMTELKGVASNYARIENAIAVLSDLRADMSYICYGGFANIFGLGKDVKEGTFESIWEKDIFSRIHPDDLDRKHAQELCFFHFIKQQPRQKRRDYYLMSKLRMRTTTNSYIPVMHRMFYIFGKSGETLRMALCLYSPLIADFQAGCLIIDSSDGHIIETENKTTTAYCRPEKTNIGTYRQRHDKQGYCRDALYKHQHGEPPPSGHTWQTAGEKLD